MTYHQYGTARRMSSGKAIVVTIRRVVEGLTFRVSSAGVILRPLPTLRGLSELTEPVVVVDMLSGSDRRYKVSHGLF